MAVKELIKEIGEIKVLTIFGKELNIKQIPILISSLLLLILTMIFSVSE